MTSHNHPPINPGEGFETGSGKWVASGGIVEWPIVGCSSSDPYFDNTCDLAHDGNRDTHWWAPGRADNWLQMDLGSPQKVTSVLTEMRNSSDIPTGITIEGSDSPTGPYTTLLAETPGTEWSGEISHEFAEQTFRYIRLLGSTGTEWWQVTSFQVFGPGGGAPGVDEAFWNAATWTGEVGLLGVNFRIQVALAVTGVDEENFFYDDPSSLYDTANYSTDEIDWFTLENRVESFRCFRGRNHLGEDMNVGTAHMVLSNEDGILNPFLGANIIGNQSLRPGRWIRIQGKQSKATEWTNLWFGSIESMGDQYTDAANRIVSSWNCVDILGWLNAQSPPPTDVEDPTSVGQTPTQRARYIWDVLMGQNPDFLQTANTSSKTMVGTTFPGSRLSQFERLAEVGFTDVFMTRDGVLKLEEVEWLKDKPLEFSIGTRGDDIDVLAAKPTWDRTRVVNQLSATADFDGAIQQIQVDTASQALYGVRSLDMSGLQFDDDSDVAEWIAWQIGLLAYATQRLDSVTLWVSEFNDVDTMLEVELGQRVRCTIQTGQGWSYTVEAWVMGVEHIVTAKDWGIMLRLDNTDRTSPLTSGPFSSAYNTSYDAQT